MLRIKILGQHDDQLRAHLLRGANADEEAAFLLAATHKRADGIDFLVREVLPVPDDALLTKGRAGLEIDPIFIARVLKRARNERLSMFMCHSHPFCDGGVSFSSIDDAGETLLFPRLFDQAPGPHGAIVFGRNSRDARVWLQPRGPGADIDEVVVIGASIEIVSPTSARQRRLTLELGDAVARQVLALGEDSNRKVSRLKLGLVGGGGVGSVIFDGAVRIGVADIVCIDGDVLTKGNVSRETGAGLSDVDKPKVDVLSAYAARVGFGTRVTPIRSWMQQRAAVAPLLECDALVVATDTMKSRVLATRIGSQYLIPIISVGIDIVPGADGSIASIGGHIAVQLPGGPCLDCLGLIDHEVLEREEMSPDARAANPYIRGRDPNDAAPSVHVFNQVVGGQVGIELLQLATGRVRTDELQTYLIFDGRTGEVRRVRAKRIRECSVCSEVSAWADRFSLPT